MTLGGADRPAVMARTRTVVRAEPGARLSHCLKYPHQTRYQRVKLCRFVVPYLHFSLSHGRVLSEPDESEAKRNEILKASAGVRQTACQPTHANDRPPRVHACDAAGP